MKKLLLILSGCAVIGFAFWLGARNKAVEPDMAAIATETAVADPEPAAQPAPPPPADQPTNRTGRVFQRSQIKWRDRSPTNHVSNSPEQAALNEKIEQLLVSEESDSEVGKKLLELYPSAPPEQQADLMLEIASRLEDKDYGKLSNILTNTASSEDVVDTLLTDLLNRSDKLRLPLLLDMARSTENPKAEDARDLMEAIMGQDNGEDWNLWSQKISEWLASHPE